MMMMMMMMMLMMVMMFMMMMVMMMTVMVMKTRALPKFWRWEAARLSLWHDGLDLMF